MAPIFGKGRTDVVDLRARYIDLLIGSLTHTLFAGVDRAEVPEDVGAAVAEAMKESDEGWLLFDDEAARAQGRDLPLYAQTMIGLERMRNLRSCVESVLADKVPGDLIEAGVWRGGASILMRGILAAYGDRKRRVYVADSFAGLPPPNPERFPQDAKSTLHDFDALAASLDEVRDNFRRYDLLDDQVQFAEGWFRDTLPALADRRWAVVRLDGDMYESTMDGLTNLYDGLSPGGYLIIDDFSVPSCRAAVEDYRREHRITDEIQEIDWTGVFWRKAG